MPHSIIDRLRSVKALEIFPCTFPYQEFTLEVFEFTASWIFVVGSVCFLPQYEHNLTIFLSGCILFVVGSVIFLAISMFTMVESWQRFPGVSIELMENFLYLVGSWLFTIGTFLYWPEKAHHEHIELLKDYSLGQYFNLFTPEFEGTVFFVIGSVLFAFGAFANALNHTKYEKELPHLITSVTTLHMAGDMLFIMGSVAFLPDLGCNSKMMAFGAWTFVIGSIFFVAASCINFYRILLIWKTNEGQQLLTPDEK